MQLSKIEYKSLNARQKENYNFQKISALLADYGFATMRLSDDWNGADFLAMHIDGVTTLKVQLKGRLTFGEKYRDKDLWVCFPHGADWYLYPHDPLLEVALLETAIGRSESWIRGGLYTFNRLSETFIVRLEQYRLPSTINNHSTNARSPLTA
jgi:hypothetical protein